MHIGLCSPTWPPDRAVNSIATYVAAIRGHFIAQGHRVSIISQGRMIGDDGSETSIRPPPQQQRRPVASLLRRLNQPFEGHRGALPRVGREVAAEVAAAQRIRAIDVVEMEESFGWSEIVQRTTGVPVVTRLHGPHFLKPPPTHGTAGTRADRERCDAEGVAVRSARTLTAPTRATLAAACDRYGRVPDSISAVIPSPVRIAPAAARWHHGACEPDSILMVGGFDPMNGAETMLIAFERLLERRPSARLTLVGPDSGIALAAGHTIGFEAFARASLSPRARERVTFLAETPANGLARLRQAANVTVVASRHESVPYALLEGFAAGCPMISADWPGSSEVITHGRTGLVTNPGRPGLLAEQIEFLCAHPGVAGQLAAAGLEHCAKAFSIDAVGEQLLECYQAAIERPIR